MSYDKSNSIVLIVDDTPENITILGEYLAEYKIKVARSGLDALALIEAGTIPDIILLDVMMPGIDGYETCRRIKANEATNEIPVIFITSMSEIEDKVKGFRLGAVDYITKPFQLEEVKTRIETHVTLYNYRRKLENVNSILEQKVAERTFELTRAKEKAEEANRLKSHFFALMSHELRTPMVGILGYAEVLMDEVQNEELKVYAENLNESAIRLKETLESILILTKLESQTHEVHPAVFILEEKMNDLIQRHMHSANFKGLKMAYQNKSTSKEVYYDITMFEIIINNLINNAVKYTDKGKVSIESYNETHEGRLYDCIRVSDTGIGIPKEKQGLIFEEFRQVYEGMTRNFEGVGLGLSLVKKYVNLLGGKIELESEVGKGSVFTIKLPQWEKVEVIPKSEVKDSVVKLKERIAYPDKQKVLLVEDDRINVEVTKLYLENVCDIDIAYDGASAIQMAKRNDYSAILMDINLGKGLSGIEVTKIIKQLEQYKETPVIAYTAFAMDGDKEDFIKEGCTHYLQKPYKKQDLLDLINDVI